MNNIVRGAKPNTEPFALRPGEYADPVIVAAVVAGNGWPVLAIREGSKSPLTAGGENHRDAWLRSPAEVLDAAEGVETPRGWTRAKCFAAMTGESLDGGPVLVALDLDGDPASLDALLAEAGPEAQRWAASTVRVERGGEGRAHIYGVADAESCPTTNGHLAEGLEWRARGGFVLLPASKHPSGSRYRIVSGELSDDTEHAFFDGIDRDAEGQPFVRWRRALPVPAELLAVVRKRGQDAVVRGQLDLDDLSDLDDLDGLDPEPVSEALSGPVGVSDPARGHEPAPAAPRAQAVAEGRGASYEARMVASIVAGLDDARGWPEGHRDERGRGWERLCADAAYRLARLALAEWSELTTDDAEGLLLEHAPTGGGWRRSDVSAKWRSQLRRAQAAGPLELRREEAVEIVLTDDSTEKEEGLTVTITGTDTKAEGRAAGGNDVFAVRVAEELCRLKVREEAARLLAVEKAAAQPPTARVLRAGGSFLLDAPECPVPVWGEGAQVLMAEGEALLIVGGSGVGKTTLAQQLALGRAGVPGFGTLLGLPVTRGEGRVLYLAMDRPSQAARSMRRMVTEAYRELLDERLRIWSGPPPANFTEEPDALLRLCREAGADFVVIDSLKDVGSVVDDEGGTGWNIARQTALAEGVQVLELHHNRKGQLEGIDDVYGSTWITSGAGSVVALVGAAGDPIVKLRHLKQPAESVGPFDVFHDHAVGRSRVWESVDLLELAARPEGLDALSAARAIFETAKPTANEREKARRRLQAEERAGRLRVIDPGDKGRGKPMVWGVADA